MKLFAIRFLFALFSLSIFPAFARGWSNADSKHGSSHRRAESDAIDYAKFEWLADDNQLISSVTRIVISLADQRLYAYHAGQLIGWSNVSTGRPGFETPVGTFDVSQKDVDHHSSLYQAAPMPFFMRLTDSGVGIHAGELPGYAASHGCVRLPLGMARELFQHVDPGTPVSIEANSQNVAVG